MNPADDIERSVKNLRFRTSRAGDERIIADASTALEQKQALLLDAKASSVWRTILRSKWTTLTAAAAAVVVMGVLLPVAFERSTAPAYAIDQTIEATRAVRSIHVKFEPAGDGLGELWAQFGENEELLRIRMDFPNTPADGPKVVVWQDGKAQVWFKRTKGALVVHEKDPLRHFGGRDRSVFFNPKIVVDRLLLTLNAEGIEIAEPTTEGDPITLTVTKGRQDEIRLVFQVDAKTKLLQRIEKFLRKGERRKLASTVMYLGYDESVDPNAFILKLPDDVVRVDQTAEDLGLPKGDLPKAQIAAKVAREFFEAIIAKDYAKAGKLCGGLPAKWVPKRLRATNAVRIVSIGEPTPHPEPRTMFQCVPCEIELETNGTTKVKTFQVNIRPLYTQRDRWAVGGGDIFK